MVLAPQASARRGEGRRTGWCRHEQHGESSLVALWLHNSCDLTSVPPKYPLPRAYPGPCIITTPSHPSQFFLSFFIFTQLLPRHPFFKLVKTAKILASPLSPFLLAFLFTDIKRCLPTHRCIAEAAGALPMSSWIPFIVWGHTSPPPHPRHVTSLPTASPSDPGLSFALGLPESLSLHGEVQVARNFRPPHLHPPRAALNLWLMGLGVQIAQQPSNLAPWLEWLWGGRASWAGGQPKSGCPSWYLAIMAIFPSCSLFLPLFRLFLRIVLLPERSLPRNPHLTCIWFCLLSLMEKKCLLP